MALQLTKVCLGAQQNGLHRSTAVNTAQHLTGTDYCLPDQGGQFEGRGYSIEVIYSGSNEGQQDTAGRVTQQNREIVSELKIYFDQTRIEEIKMILVSICFKCVLQ